MSNITVLVHEADLIPLYRGNRKYKNAKEKKEGKQLVEKEKYKRSKEDYKRRNEKAKATKLKLQSTPVTK